MDSDDFVIKQNVIGIILMAFIIGIIGFNLITTSSNTINDVTELQSVINESGLMWLNQTNMSTAKIKYTALVVRNCTGNDIISPTEYTEFAIVGKIQCNTNTTVPNNKSICVSYSYPSSNYVNDGTSRQVTKLIILFFALGILGTVIGILYPYIKDSISW